MAKVSARKQVSVVLTLHTRPGMNPDHAAREIEDLLLSGVNEQQEQEQGVSIVSASAKPLNRKSWGDE